LTHKKRRVGGQKVGWIGRGSKVEVTKTEDFGELETEVRLDCERIDMGPKGHGWIATG